MNGETVRKMEETARGAILEAGDLIRDRFGTPLSIESKGKHDYVTNVDQESEALIIERIKSHFPDHHVMSEEMTNPIRPPGITWIIDPLDGTTNFIHGFPIVSVSIAAYADEEAILGLVLDPIRGELFSATKGNGAYLNGYQISVSNTASLHESMVATGFPFKSKHMVDQYMETFKRIFNRVSDIRRAGSAALDLVYVAAGRVEGFWEMGLSAWDIAAGALLVREAGGYVSDFWGEGEFLRNGHIIAGTKKMHGFLLEQVRSVLVPVLEAQVRYSDPKNLS
jgi:myo-inositol-1(or 4)-monophosphatase